MTELFDQAQVLVRITTLTQGHLTALIEAEAVIPVVTNQGLLFSDSDLARLNLLCELEELYEMKPEALAVVIAIIDRMHAARQDRHNLLAAIATETVEVRQRIAAALVWGSGEPTSEGQV